METTAVVTTREPRWRALAPFAAGGGIAAAVGAVGFGLQAVTLPRASSAALAGVQAERWLVRHRVVDSTARIDGRAYSATCAGGWIGPARQFRKRTRGSLLVTSRRDQLVKVHGEVFRERGVLTDDDTPLAAAKIELAACPFSLGRVLGDSLARRRPLQLRTVTIFGRVAYRFVLPAAGGGLDLYVART